MITGGTAIGRADIWMGDQADIGLIVAEDVSMLLPALERDVLAGEVVYRSPIEAPIAQGQEVAELVLTLKDLPDVHIPLVSDRSVARGGFLTRLRTAAIVLYRQYVGRAQSAY